MRHPSSNEYELIAIRISSVSISGQNPGWILNVYDNDKIELLDTIRMVDVVIRCQVKISNDLISSAVIIYGTFEENETEEKGDNRGPRTSCSDHDDGVFQHSDAVDLDPDFVIRLKCEIIFGHDTRAGQ